MTNQTQTAKLFPIRGAYGLSSHSKVAYHDRAVKAAATRKANQLAAKRQHNAEVMQAFWCEVKYGFVALAIAFSVLLIAVH